MKILKQLPKAAISTSNIYLCEHLNQQGVFKMFLLPYPEFEKLYSKLPDIPFKNEQLEYYMRMVNGLVYESNIYSEIIDKINKKKISPNFLAPLLDERGEELINGWYESQQTFVGFLIEIGELRVSEPSSIKTARQLYRHAFSATRSQTDIEALHYFLYQLYMLNVPPSKLVRSVYHTFTELVKTGKEQAEDGHDKFMSDVWNICSLADQMQVVGIVTERIGRSTTLDELLVQLSPRSHEDVQETLNIVFQLVAGLYVMQLIGLQHNDLHLRNIMIKALPRPVTLEYMLKIKNVKGHYVEKKYRMRTIFVVKFFDWDVSFMNHWLFERGHRRENINSKINSDHFRKIGVLNKIVPYFDAFTLSCVLTSLYTKHPDIALSKLKAVNIFFHDPSKDYISSASIYQDVSTIRKDTARTEPFDITPLTQEIKQTSGPAEGNIYYEGFVSDGFGCRANVNTDKLSEIFVTFPEMLVRLGRIAKLEVKSFESTEPYFLGEVPDFFDYLVGG